jgi:two-component system sensor histidine kinase KdpD
MRGDKLNDEEKQGLIESVASEANRLVRLIENLLALARVELGREVDSQPVSASELAYRVTHSFQQSHSGRTVECTSEEDVPQIMVEPTYFEQVLLNLLTNADKYSPADSPIEVAVHDASSEVQVLVRDSGPGVPEDELDSIFDSFYRVESTASKAVGHGLGLTVCKRLVEVQSGRIWATNRKEGGFEVGFAFPSIATPVKGARIA